MAALALVDLFEGLSGSDRNTELVASEPEVKSAALVRFDLLVAAVPALRSLDGSDIVQKGNGGFKATQTAFNAQSSNNAG